ncbi:MAG TPA: hypothetical protein VMM60_07030 [Ilumatobacter sp.]|nr:hypothetical protein [Ilumatobacter sp.]
MGDFERSVDANGRLTLPSIFRDKLDDTACYLTRDLRGCLLITPRADFDEQSRVIIDKVNRGELPITAKPAMGGMTMVINVDRQGRFTIDEANRKHAGIRNGSSVRMIGALNTIEMWRESRYTVIEGEKAPDQRARQWDDSDDSDGEA